MLKMDRLPNERLFRILERLAEEGFLQNNRKLDVQLNCPRNSRFFEVICSMKNLETLSLIDYNLTLDALAQVCQSCPKLTDLHIAATKLVMCEHLKQQLRPAFQRLRKFALECGFHYIYSWPVIQEMCT